MNEQAFYSRWKEVAEGLAPFEMAQRAGAVAETPGQIFTAGYQAAVRHTFPEVNHAGWCCFAVTEDRSPESAFPGVSLVDGKVSGFKTWIAAADCVELLVLKVGGGAEARYGTVLAKDPGVTIKLRPGKFLADMSQGAAEFNQAEFVEFVEVPEVRTFRQYEPYYIYVAFLARLAALELDSGDSRVGEIKDLVLSALAEQIDLVQIDSLVSHLLDLMAQLGLELGSDWTTDKRLFTMYSSGIQRL
tara:strand:- start:34282 stop:35016 length:735 start_codon:yes stop_codon:yes gene_type:complete